MATPGYEPLALRWSNNDYVLIVIDNAIRSSNEQCILYAVPNWYTIIFANRIGIETSVNTLPIIIQPIQQQLPQQY